MINLLNVGDTIVNTRELSDARVQHWKYAKECSRLGGTFNPNSRFTVLQVNKVMGSLWVKVEIPGSYGNSLKIAGDEFGPNFKVV